MKRHISLLIFLVVLLIPIVSSSEAGVPASGFPDRFLLASNAWEERPFRDTSPLNIKIPENAAIEPNSDAIVNNMVGSMSEGEIFVGIDLWSVPVFFADSTTPRYDVDLTDEWVLWDFMEGVPIPDNAVPDPEDDGHMTIVDNDTRIEYDFWQANKTSSGWTATWGNKISLDSDGIFTDSWSARGSGFALTAGLIFPDEVARGQIDHALAYSTDWFYVKSGGAVRPATTSDGMSNEPLAIPEGTRLQLDPSMDIDSLDIPASGKVIARALQEYGMFLCDNGGGHQLYAYNPIGSDKSWAGMLPTDEDGISWIFNSQISITDFRVLKIGSQFPGPGDRTTLPDYTLYTTDDGTSSTTEPLPWQSWLTNPYLVAIVALPVVLAALYVVKQRRR